MDAHLCLRIRIINMWPSSRSSTGCMNTKGGGSAAAKASSNSLLTGMTNRLPDLLSRCHWSSCFDIFLALVPEQEVIAVLNQLNGTHEPMSESALKSYKLEQQTHIERLQLRLPLESNATSWAQMKAFFFESSLVISVTKPLCLSKYLVWSTMHGWPLMPIRKICMSTKGDYIKEKKTKQSESSQSLGSYVKSRCFLPFSPARIIITMEYRCNSHSIGWGMLLLHKWGTGAIVVVPGDCVSTMACASRPTGEGHCLPYLSSSFSFSSAGGDKYVGGKSPHTTIRWLHHCGSSCWSSSNIVWNYEIK